MITINTGHQEGLQPNFTTWNSRLDNYAEVEARAEVAPSIATWAFAPLHGSVQDEFADSILAPALGIQTKDTLPQTQAGVTGLALGWADLKKFSTENFKFKIFHEKKALSNRKLQAATIAAAGPGLSITADFSYMNGGAPLYKGSKIIMKDVNGTAITFYCDNIGTMVGTVQTGVVLFPADGTVTAGVIDPSSYVFDVGSNDDTVSISPGYIQQPQFYNKDYELSTFHKEFTGIFNQTSLHQKVYFGYTNNPNDPYYASLMGKGNDNSQLWLSEVYKRNAWEALKILHRGMLFDEIPANPNPAVYNQSADGGRVVPKDGVITQIRRGGRDTPFPVGTLTLSDFDDIYKRYRDDSLAGSSSFSVFGSYSFMKEASQAMSAGITSQTMLQTEFQPNPNFTGLHRNVGWAGFASVNGSNFRFKEMRTLSNHEYYFSSSAIVVPNGLQVLRVNGVNTTSPSVIMAFYGDSLSPIWNRSGGSYSGDKGMMPFLKPYVFCHPDMKKDIFLGSEHVVETKQEKLLGDLQVIGKPMLAIICCVGQTSFMHEQ